MANEQSISLHPHAPSYPRPADTLPSKAHGRCCRPHPQLLLHLLNIAEIPC